MNWKDQLPEELLPYLAHFEATAIPCVRLKVSDTPPVSPQSSCIGQVPYWPKNLDWPRDERAQPLFGLVQLNLSEFPQVLPGASAGLLQFFVSDDVFWGASPTAPDAQLNNRVVFHDAQTLASAEVLDDFSFLPSPEEWLLASEKCLALTGQADSMPLPPDDWRFPRYLETIFTAFGERKWELLNAYRKAIGTVGHRLGGYAGLIQDDHRNSQNQWELLLQLDTDPAIGLHWGDYGVAHWFYKPTTTERGLDAPQRVFANIWYAWASN